MADIESSDISPKFLEDWWNNSSAGKKGSSIFIAKYGLPGTKESRSLGGKRSYAIRKYVEGDIFSPKSIKIPSKSVPLAELVGILIGDGSINKYQVSVTVSSLVDEDYCLYISNLFEELFGLKPSVTKRRNANCLVITVSSKLTAEFLVKTGLPMGNKLQGGLDIPGWIKANPKFAKACLRGIFDTDGGIYLEKHVIKGVVYSYPRMSFVSMSGNLRDSIYRSLMDMGLNPKMRNNRSVNLENFEDIKKYFKLVETSNSKHLRRFINFGGVG